MLPDDMIYHLELPLDMIGHKASNKPYSLLHVRFRYHRALAHLQELFGCITSALAWLHDHQIPHTNLVPGKILLSSTGIWLMGLNGLMEVDLDHSETAGDGKANAYRYVSPERWNYAPCGLSEDIIMLGCTFLEMAYRLAQPWFEDFKQPWAIEGDRPWPFQASLENIAD
jgi:serine/threonine protein kinase